MKKYLLALILIPLIATPVLALTHKGNTVYKTVSPKNTLYISGTPGQVLEVIIPGTLTGKVAKADACGVVKFIYSEDSQGYGVDLPDLKVNNSSVALFSGINKFPYSCVSGAVNFDGSPGTAPSSWIEATSNNYAYFSGYTPNSEVSITYTKQSVRKPKVNDCGFARITSTTSTVIGDNTPLIIDGNSYNFSTIVNAVNPPVCRTVGTTKKGYIPLNW
jgi:hypothetical protein